jgi:hypothetical protein
MKRAVVVALLIVAAGCAKNRESEETGTSRIRDTTLTARDSTKPSDTLPHIRDSMPDSTRK